MNQDRILKELLEQHDTVEDGRRLLHPTAFKRITGKTVRQARQALAKNGAARPLKPKPNRATGGAA